MEKRWKTLVQNTRGTNLRNRQEGNYATKLITQFNGKELDTSSCLAFAPKNKHGSNGQATQADWQVNSNDDFIQLEPWAVPCDNSWMKDQTVENKRDFVSKCINILR